MLTRLCFFIICLFNSPVVVWADSQPKNTIYFYNSETNINNFVSLKISFDTYLSRFGDYQFQPFNKKDIFEKSVTGNHHGVLLLSSWHYKVLADEIDLQPVMVGVINGQSTQKKILSVKYNITNVSALEGKTIACSGSEQYTKNLLNEMLGDENFHILDTIKLILVPKDIDALMAVGFGMASAALTTERSVENLQKINPKLHQSLNPLLVSQDYYLALAAMPGVANENELLDILQKMGINPEGEIRLRMLGLDGWRRLSAQEKLLLKQKGHKGL